MNIEMETKFEKIGARVKVKKLGFGQAKRDWRGFTPRPITVDIRRDERGEYFDVRHRSDVTLDVLDVKRTDRHLLLMVRQPEEGGAEIKSKFLCGHDERSWFVAAIPESANARDVQTAKDALKPRKCGRRSTSTSFRRTSATRGITTHSRGRVSGSSSRARS